MNSICGLGIPLVVVATDVLNLIPASSAEDWGASNTFQGLHLQNAKKWHDILVLCIYRLPYYGSSKRFQLGTPHYPGWYHCCANESFCRPKNDGVDCTHCWCCFCMWHIPVGRAPRGCLSLATVLLSKLTLVAMFPRMLAKSKAKWSEKIMFISLNAHWTSLQCAPDNS